MPIEPGSFVEVVAGWKFQGAAGIVQSVEGNKTILQPVKTDDDWLTPTGEPIEIHTGNLMEIPTPTDIRRGKRHLREKHIAELRPPNEQPPGNIRVFRYRY